MVTQNTLQQYGNHMHNKQELGVVLCDKWSEELSFNPNPKQGFNQ